MHGLVQRLYQNKAMLVSQRVCSWEMLQKWEVLCLLNYSAKYVMHTVFERNHAACKMNCAGGALYTKYSSVSVCNSTFYSNKLIHFGDLRAGYIAYGGAIGLLESMFSAQSCIFKQNGQHGNGLGGVLFAHNATIIINR